VEAGPRGGAAAPGLAGGLRGAAAELPLLVVAALLLATGADILPPDSIVSAGPVELTLARLLVLLGLAALVYAHGPRRELFATGLAIPVGLLLVASLVATARWGTEPRFRFLLEAVALFYLTVAAVRARPEVRPTLALVALVALALSALPGVAQVAQDEATGFYRDGCRPVTEPPPLVPGGTVTRATGTFDNPNVLAGHVLLLAPLSAAGIAALAAGWQLRRALAVVLGLALVGLVLTYSRSGILVALLGLVAALAVSGVAHRRQLIGAAAALLVATFFLFGSCGSEGVAGYGRTEQWKETISVIGDNPVTGVGLGRAGDVLRERDDRHTARHAHNLFLNWWAEAGPLALLAWIWLLAVLAWRSLRAALAGDEIARGTMVAVGGFAAYSMLDHPANVDRIALALWVTMALAAALPRAPLRRAAGAPEAARA
jgi:putative inorganic carbon (HCO3(-)) transporter